MSDHIRHYPTQDEQRHYQRLCDKINASEDGRIVNSNGEIVDTRMWPVEALRQCGRLAAGLEQFGE